ncbi:aldo/keto reductase [Propionibacterium australiense]|uniref:Aldo-keto reductase signature n=1 Tax=Propionibacterium australiense TaxID=119981 RepID=A0A383S7N3_9ACTN|nr:aldo/keto reductase [Propionibacterium australiense]RLP09665.1 aldo/keto reductase [Propionibacterium australiense]RLP12367.1 aldo/keto reductase [Propionibacterium australiense]SYZ33572.1 Aldo-keto reductase signature [Propionibacterium australiense]VEH89548.1 Morphine 6-dehydrogenase [Propionibacterium australiense]
MITLNNGVEMPQIGFGVFQTEPAETKNAVLTALEVGYRHVDTAAGYGNEREVGQAIRESGLPREKVFVETKIWISDYGFEKTRHGFEKSNDKLGLGYIDLLILHQPASASPESFADTIGAYQALERLLAEGRVRAIGVSNFQDRDLDELLAATDIIPAVNQVEYHPYFHGARERDGIVVQAWSPIGGITFYPGWGENRTSTLENPVLARIAAQHGKSVAQVMLRWHLQEGRSAIPKSVRPHRIAENFDIFDFELSAEELAAIDALDTGTRNGPDPSTMSTKNPLFEIPEA